MKFACSHRPTLFWTCVLAFCTNWSLQETGPPDPCDEFEPKEETYHHGTMTGDKVLNDASFCSISPKNMLNCSMPSSFFPVIQMSASVTMCDEEGKKLATMKCAHEDIGASERSFQSKPVILCQESIDNYTKYLSLHINISGREIWTIYSLTYEAIEIEILSPPSDVEASVSNDNLLVVTWGVPKSLFSKQTNCFVYQISISGQDKFINVTADLEYREMKAEPTHTYDVKMRVKKSTHCLGLYHWSDWSPIIRVNPKESRYEFSIPVIICIAVVIPMFLVALVILVRLRATVLYPPIPQPPKNYINFMEKMDDFHFVPPVLSHVEEITVVEEPDQCPEKTIK